MAARVYRRRYGSHIADGFRSCGEHLVELTTNYRVFSLVMQVDVQFDTSNVQIARQTIDYASKKASE